PVWLTAGITPSTGTSNATWTYALAASKLTTLHTYNVYVQATDATTSGNTSGALSAGSFTYDNSAPANASLTTNGVYDAAGLPTLSGTTNDAGQGGNGISLTKVAIRDGSGNYYDGSSFSSGSPVWLAVTSGGTSSGGAD